LKLEQIQLRKIIVPEMSFPFQSYSLKTEKLILMPGVGGLAIISGGTLA
jgi:hypothetical protein